MNVAARKQPSVSQTSKHSSFHTESARRSVAQQQWGCVTIVQPSPKTTTLRPFSDASAAGTANFRADISLEANTVLGHLIMPRRRPCIFQGAVNFLDDFMSTNAAQTVPLYVAPSMEPQRAAAL